MAVVGVALAIWAGKALAQGSGEIPWAWWMVAAVVTVVVLPLELIGLWLTRAGQLQRAASSAAPYVHILVWHTPALLAHSRALLRHGMHLAPYTGSLVAGGAPLLDSRHLDRIVPHLDNLVPYIAALAPKIPQLAIYFDSLLPVLPELAPYIGHMIPYLVRSSMLLRCCHFNVLVASG